MVKKQTKKETGGNGESAKNIPHTILSWSKTKEDFLLRGEEDVSLLSTLENVGIHLCLLLLRTIASYQDPCRRSTAQAIHKVNSPLTYPKSYRNIIIISSEHSPHP